MNDMRNKAVLNHSDVVKSVCPKGQAEQLVYRYGNKVLIKEIVYNEYTDEMIQKDKQVISGLLEKCFITGSRAKVAHLVRLTESNEHLRCVDRNSLEENYTKYLKRNGHKFDDEDYIVQQDDVTPEEAMSLSRLHQHFMQTNPSFDYYGVDTPLMIEHPTSRKKIDVFVVPFVTNHNNFTFGETKYISLNNLIEACVRMDRFKDWKFIELIFELKTNTNYVDHDYERTTITSKLIRKIIGL